MSVTSPSSGQSLGFPGIPGVLNTSHQPGGTEPATPNSDISETDFLSPSGLANSSKKFWTESSSWIASRINYQSQSSSSGYSSVSVDRPVSLSGPTCICK